MTAVAIITAPPSVPDLLGTAPSDLIPSAADRRDSTLDEARARSARLTDGIVGYAQMRQDIADAFAGRDWFVLGYASWDAYVEGEFGELLAKLDRNERRQAIGDLRGQGMSTRQIAKATGISKDTVHRTLQAGVSDETPATVTGSDGKQHPATRPTPKPIPTPEPATATTAPVAGSGTTSPEPEAEPERERHLSVVRESSPAPTLRVEPSASERQLAEQRDARGLLLRVVEILAPDHDRPGFAQTWARQLGPYDEELSDLIRRAADSISTLDDLIEGCGQ